MGQTIIVAMRAGVRSDVRFFDLNRSLTGMGIERYDSVESVRARRPADVLARRLFDLGATTVTVYSNAIAVEAPEEQWDALAPRVRHAIEHLFEYYGDEAGWSPQALGAESEVDPVPADSLAESSG